MNVSLTPELERFVSNKVDSGRHRTASEVIREALRLLEERDRHRDVRLEDLRQEIHRGLASGPTKPLDAEALKRRVRATLAGRKSRKGG